MRAQNVVVDIGDVPIALRTSDRPLVGMLEQRFGRFLTPGAEPAFAFDVTVVAAADPEQNADEDLRVTQDEGRWQIARGDFSAQWNTASRLGWIRQPRNPYSVDTLLRIVHTVILSSEGGFLLHASSAIRNGRAFLFTGPSGAGKTTIARLAPADATVLTDEISYVRRGPVGFVAFGTPFAGDWGDAGVPARAPIAAFFSLGHSGATTRTPLAKAAAVRTLMRNILFFAEDPALTRCVFDTACDFAARVDGFHLAFAPDAGAWDAIA